MSFFEIFDKAYCVNLERRKDRLFNFELQVKKYDLGPYARFRAFDGFTAPTSLNKGNAGLIKSVIAVLQECLDEGTSKVLILEDDCEFKEDIINIYEYFKYVPSDWDMLYFGGNHNIHIGKESPKRINERIAKLHYTFTTHCVAIRRHMFEPIIQKIGSYKSPIDVAYQQFQQTHNVYGFYPSIVKQASGFSDIQGHHVDYDWLIT